MISSFGPAGQESQRPNAVGFLLIRMLQLNSSSDTCSLCKSSSVNHPLGVGINPQCEIKSDPQNRVTEQQSSYLSFTPTVYELKAGIQTESHQPAVYLYQPVQTWCHHGEVWSVKLPWAHVWLWCAEAWTWNASSPVFWTEVIGIVALDETKTALINNRGQTVNVPV